MSPCCVYHDAVNSIVFVMINKVDEYLNEKKKNTRSLDLFLSLSLSLSSLARARARAETSSMCLSLSRLVGDTSILSVKITRAIPNGRVG